MPVAIIINPRAGVRRHETAGRVALARDVLRQHAMAGEVIVTEDREHARRTVRARLEAGVDTVVACLELAAPIIAAVELADSHRQ